MAKHKRRRPNGPHGNTAKPRTHNLQSQSQSAKQRSNLSAAKGKAHAQAQHTAPIIPFNADDRILLIGEADLSFARSLIEHHSCAHVTATVLEKDVEELGGKYPHVIENITVVEKEGGELVYGVDAMKMGAWTEGGKGASSQRVGGMDKVVFNFPHVGGKSTDINRQVRYNQGMKNAVSFTWILADNEWHRASGFILQESHAVCRTWWLNYCHSV
jgi:25S rRNA (uracil2634-N3)-methyltransferase